MKSVKEDMKREMKADDALEQLEMVSILWL